MSEHAWVVECVAQFLRSPLWTTPVHDFIDDHCILFSGTSDAGCGPLGEQSIEHTTIHNRFRELVDNLITEYIEELGVPAEDVLRACETTESDDGAKFLEYMYALDKYETFVLLMARRNAELEAEALRQLNASVSRASVSSSSQPAAAPEEAPSKDAESGAAPSAAAEQDDDDADLKAAIEASLKESAGASAHREAELEDAELQRALQLSLAMEDQRKARELELIRLEEEEIAKSKAEAEALAAAAAAAAAAPAPPVVEAVAEAPKKEKKTEAQVHEESAQRQEAIKSTVHQARVENAERAVAPPHAPAQKPAAAAEGAMSPLSTSPSQGGANQEPAPQQGAPVPMPAPLQATPVAAPAAPATNAKPALPGLGSLRAGRSGASFGGFAKLPSIGGPAPATAMSFDELKSQAALAKGEVAPAAPPAPESEEAIKLRAEHMRKQREKLMALKKQERQNDLDKFRSENGVPAAIPEGAATSPAKNGTDAQHQDLTRQLARRFRTDIASTAKQ